MIRHFTVLVAFASALSLPAMGCDDDPPQRRPRPVRYATIGAGSADDARAFSAIVQARDATQLSFRVGGNLAELKVERGARVKKGELVGALDESDFKVQLAQSRANYANAKTQRDVAKSGFRRAEKLYEAGSSSLSDYENAKGQLESAAAQLAATGQQVKQARNQLEYTRLRAPFDGIVNSVPVKSGEQVNPGQPIAVVSKGGELEISVGVPENMIARIKVGTSVEVTISALGDRTFTGKVREVGFTPVASTYPVAIELDELPAELRPGMAADARFDLGVRSAALVVPVTAVANAESGSYVFVLEGKSGELYVVRKVAIEVGELLGDSFALETGLDVGAKVATAGLTHLVDGMTVRLLTHGEAAAGARP